MKKALLFLFSVSLGLALNAQLTIEGTCPENVWADFGTETSVTGSNKIKNEGGTAVGALKWMVTGNTFPSGWMSEFAFCDPEFCHPKGTTSATTSFNFTMGMSGDFKPQFAPPGPGSGSVSVCGWIDGDSASTVQCCDYQITFTGLEEINIDGNVKLYPNPAKNVLVAELDDYQLEKVEIFDIVGQKVKEVDMSNASEYKIDVSDLTEGMFIVKLHTSEGPIATKTFKRIN